MIKGLIVLENGFEDSEAVVTYDLLKRAGVTVDACSIYQNNIISQNGLHYNTKYLLSDINLNDYSFLILPGGRAVFEVLDKSKEIDSLIDHFYSNNKLICAICAAPLLIGKRGYFKNLDYTCFPGCEEKIIGGNKLNDGVVKSGNFITARAAFYSCDFGVEIAKTLGYDEKALRERFKGNI